MKADAERLARERGVTVAEVIRQAVTHYVAWCEAQNPAPRNDESPAG